MLDAKFAAMKSGSGLPSEDGKAPLLAAIVINYRLPDWTRRCVESLSAPVAKVYVVDNSAQPESAHHLALSLIHLPREAAPVQVFGSPSNLGFASGIQFGIDHALAERSWDGFFIINNDAIVQPTLLRRMVETWESEPGPVLVAPARDDRGQPLRLWYHRVLGIVLEHPWWGTVPYLSGTCLLVPTRLASPRLFDPLFFIYGEDVELGWRLGQAGVPLLTVSAQAGEFRHAANRSTGNGSLFYEYHMNRAHLLLGRKLSRPGWDRVSLAMGRACMLPARALVRSVRGGGWVPWRGLLRALREDPPPPPGDEMEARR